MHKITLSFHQNLFYRPFFNSIICTGLFVVWQSLYRLEGSVIIDYIWNIHASRLLWQKTTNLNSSTSVGIFKQESRGFEARRSQCDMYDPSMKLDVISKVSQRTHHIGNCLRGNPILSNELRSIKSLNVPLWIPKYTYTCSQYDTCVPITTYTCWNLRVSK